MSDAPTTHEPALLDGRYRLDGLAGTGGMGEVHRAWDTRLGRRVAIKMLGPELVADPNVSARLRAEGRHLASIAHPNLVTLYDVSPDGATPYLVMELIDGESLAERLRREGPLPTREVAAVVTGVAAGLSALHGAGIVHRDISPANILLGRDGRPRLADLGLAQALDHAQIAPADGMIHGTLRYLAPELLDGSLATAASDVYGLAAVTYATLLGRPPAVATDVVKLRVAHREPPIRPSLLRPGLDPALDEVLLRALGPAAGRPTAYAFAVAIANALRACDDPAPALAATGLPPAGPIGVAYRAPRPHAAHRSTRRAIAAFGAGALVLTLTGAALATIDRVLERPANPELVAGLTAPSERVPTLRVEAQLAPATHAATSGAPGTHPAHLPKQGAAGTATTPVSTPATDASATTPVIGARHTAGSGAVQTIVAAEGSVSVDPNAVVADPNAALGAVRRAQTSSAQRLSASLWGSFAGMLAGLTNAAETPAAPAPAILPDATLAPSVAPQRMTGPRIDVQLAVALDRRNAATAAHTTTHESGTPAVERADAETRTASLPRTVRSGHESKAAEDRKDRQEREDHATSAAREDRSGKGGGESESSKKGSQGEDREDAKDREDHSGED